MVVDLIDTEQIISPINVYRLVNDAILRHENQILDLNRRQMFAGNDANDNAITPEYTPFTKFLKDEKGQPFDRVTLNDTGAFYQSMFLQPFDNGFEFEATDSKTDDLKEKYGENIFGIAESDLDDAAEIIKETLIDTYANELRK